MSGGAAVAVLLSVLFAALTSPLWLARAVPVWDALDLSYPVTTYVSDALREGRFPMWDPYSGAGEPFHADPTRMVLNPVLLVLGRVLPDPFLTFVLVWLLHWWWGAMGMVWLSRRFGASAPGALLAAGSFALCGFFVSNAEHTSYIFVAGWLPWILGLADRAVARRSAASALLAAAALGVCALGGGYPPLVAFTGFAVALWLALRFVAFPEDVSASRRTLALWTGGTLAAMAIVLVVAWAPVLHAFLTAGSAVASRLSATSAEEAIWGQPFTLRAATSLWFPFATLFFMKTGVPMGADVSMTNAYMGFAAVPLAATWAWIAFRERRKAWLVAFAVVMVLVSLGGRGGVRIALHYLVPGLQYMRFNAGFRLFWLLPVCLAAGLGLGLVVERERARRVFLVAVLAWAALGVLAAAVLLLWLRASGVAIALGLPSLFLPVAFAAPAVAGCAALALRRPKLAGALLAVVSCADVAAGMYVNDATVWNRNTAPLRPYLAAHVRSDPGAGAPRRRYLESVTGTFNWHLLVKKPVLRTYTSFAHTELDGNLYRTRFAEVLCGPLRFWLAPGGEVPASRERALAELAAAGAGDPLPVFVEGSTSRAPRVVPGAYGAVEVEVYRPEEVVLRAVVPAPEGGVLASVERWAPGWKVLVDGRPAAPLRTNLHFRGVFLEPGPHRVVWRYEPELWWPLVGGSVATLALVTLAAAALALRARRRAAGN